MKKNGKIPVLIISIPMMIATINQALATDIYSVLDEDTISPYHHQKVQKKAAKIFKRHIFNIEIEPSLYAKMDLGYGWFNGKITTTNYGANADGTFLLFSQINSDIAQKFQSQSYNKFASSLMIKPAVGCQFTEHFRMDVAFSQLFDQNTTLASSPNIPGQVLNGASLTLKRESWLGALTIYYDITNRFQVVPFIGLTGGYGSTTYSISNINGTIPQFVFTSKVNVDDVKTQVNVDVQAMTSNKTKHTNAGFIGGGVLGLSYKVKDNAVIELSYSVLNMQKAQTALPTKATGFFRKEDTKSTSAFTVSNSNGIITLNPQDTKTETTQSEYIATKFEGPRVLQSVNLGVRFLF